jgi:hypothetical protein
MLGLIPSINQFQNLYNTAISYLNHSPFAQEVISSLDNSPLHIGIMVIDHGGSEYIPPYSRKCPHYLDGGMICWNHTQSVNTTDFASNDPRLGPGESHRIDAPWNREQRWGAWILESVFGPRTRTGFLTPAVCLLHEMGHALQYISDPAQFQLLAQGNIGELENLNVRAIEATVVQELRGAGLTETARWDYMHQGHSPGGNAWPNWLRWFSG